MFKTNAFSDLKPFDVLTWNELKDRFILNQIELFKDTRWKIEGDYPIDSFPIKEEEVYPNTVTYKAIGYYRKCDYGKIVNAKTDLTGKTFSRQCLDNGKFLYLTLPKEIILKNKKSVLHNKDLRILNKFINEINNSSKGWTKENYLKYLKEYDETYPTKTNKTNKAEKVYKWRADFAIEWFMSLKEEGIINPILYYIDRKPDTEIKKARWEFDGRGTHRPFLIAQAGYDVPYLIRIDDDEYPIYYSDKKDYPQLLDINLKNKTVKAYSTKNIYDEICY